MKEGTSLRERKRGKKGGKDRARGKGEVELEEERRERNGESGG